MRRLGLFAILLVFVGVAVWLGMRLSASPERQIRTRMADLQRLVSFRVSDGNLAKLASLEKLGSLFTKDAEILVDAPGVPRATLSGRDSIMQAAAGARQAVGDLKVEFLDVTVMLAEDQQSAVVETIAKARELGEKDFWIQEVRFKWIQTEEGWLISLVETVRTLTRTPGHGAPVARRLRDA